MHVPPFRHGLESHSLASATKNMKQNIYILIQTGGAYLGGTLRSNGPQIGHIKSTGLPTFRFICFSSHEGHVGLHEGKMSFKQWSIFGTMVHLLLLDDAMPPHTSPTLSKPYWPCWNLCVLDFLCLPSLQCWGLCNFGILAAYMRIDWAITRPALGLWLGKLEWSTLHLLL